MDLKPDEKPLHARVAEALGWTNIRFGDPFPGMSGYGGAGYEDTWLGTPSDAIMRVNDMVGDNWKRPGGVTIRRYDTDWRSTGPLIKRYGIALYHSGPGWSAFAGEVEDYGSERYLRGGTHEYGTEPLLAVCNLILALHAAGKLEP